MARLRQIDSSIKQNVLISMALLLLVVGIYVVVAAQFSLSKKSKKIQEIQKTTADYWAETNLSDEELKLFLSSKFCLYGEKEFLSCVNAIQQAALQLGYFYNSDNSFKKLSSDDFLKLESEKNYLAPWKIVFQKIRTNQSVAPNFVKIWEAFILVKMGDENKSQVIAEALNGFLSIQRDPHSYFIPLKQYQEQIINADMFSNGFGISLKRVNGKWVIRRIFNDSKAFRMGLRRGDEILALEGADISRMQPSKVSEYFSSTQIQKIKIKVKQSNNIIKTAVLNRITEPRKIVSGNILDSSKGLGYIVVDRFSANVCKMFETELIQLQQQGMSSLIIDLRDNGGGIVSETGCIADLLLKEKGKIYETRDLKNIITESKVSSGNPKFTGAIAVLVNSGSASAAELLAGALQDYKRAIIVGERTFGKGTYQEGHIWGRNTKIAFFETKGMYYLPSGRTPQLIGINPDVQVKSTYLSKREDDLFESSIKPATNKENLMGGFSIAQMQMTNCLINKTDFDSNTIGLEPEMIEAKNALGCELSASRGIR